MARRLVLLLGIPIPIQQEELCDTIVFTNMLSSCNEFFQRFKSWIADRYKLSEELQEYANYIAALRSQMPIDQAQILYRRLTAIKHGSFAKCSTEWKWLFAFANSHYALIVCKKPFVPEWHIEKENIVAEIVVDKLRSGDIPNFARMWQNAQALTHDNRNVHRDPSWVLECVCQEYLCIAIEQNLAILAAQCLDAEQFSSTVDTIALCKKITSTILPMNFISIGKGKASQTTFLLHTHFFDNFVLPLLMAQKDQHTATQLSKLGTPDDFIKSGALLLRAAHNLQCCVGSAYALDIPFVAASAYCRAIAHYMISNFFWYHYEHDTILEVNEEQSTNSQHINNANNTLILPFSIGSKTVLLNAFYCAYSALALLSPASHATIANRYTTVCKQLSLLYSIVAPPTPSATMKTMAGVVITTKARLRKTGFDNTVTIDHTTSDYIDLEQIKTYTIILSEGEK